MRTNVIRFDRCCREDDAFRLPPPGPVDFLRGCWHRDQRDLADLAADTVGLLEALEPSSGVAVSSSVLDEDDEWLRSINFDGVVNGARAFLPILVEQDEVVVDIPRVFGLHGMPSISRTQTPTSTRESTNFYC
ncbi:hypothetical protein AB0H00_17955 [Nocardia sp. NPDC023852]|uniref:hypothetical protein n=1 Tax=Nocardia sp. NPDC023852 TaxID=3154697 RepID=UPI0033F4924F